MPPVTAADRPSSPPRLLPRSLSIYLDIVRFAAAFGVFASHLYQDKFSGGLLPWRVRAYGTPCVTIFFVLSGYVIAHSLRSDGVDGFAYARDRLSRLYSVALPCLILTALFDAIGGRIDPALYVNPFAEGKVGAVATYLASLFFVNEYGVFSFGGVAPGTNAPYWSLSFEATYYLVAGAVIFLPRLPGLLLSAVILALAGKTILALFGLWIGGYLLYAHLFYRDLGALTAALLLGSTILLLQMPAIELHLMADNFGFTFPWGRGAWNRNLLLDYLVGVTFLIHIAAARRVAEAFPHALDRVGGLCRRLGGYTFPLYCIHLPAMTLLRALSPWPSNDPRTPALIMAGVMALTVALTPACDRLRSALRQPGRAPL